jgi:hypothetical protein
VIQQGVLRLHRRLHRGAHEGLNGTCMARPAVDTEGDGIATTVQVLSDLGLHVGAGEGNRTLMTSLEGWSSAIELRPRVPAGGVSGTG